MKQFTQTFSEKVTNEHLFIFLIKTISLNSFFTCTTVFNTTNDYHKISRKNHSLHSHLYYIYSTIIKPSLLLANNILIKNILVEIQYIGSNLINIILKIHSNTTNSFINTHYYNSFATILKSF